MIPLVLAGGLGTRIRPLSANRPKPLIPVVNRPILEHVLRHLAGAGFRQALVLTYHDPARVRDAFGNGSRVGLKLRYHQDEQDYGTGGAIVRGARLAPSPRYLVISGDLLTDLDLGAVVAAHEDRKAALTIALTRQPNPLQFGIVIVDGNGRVQRFLEKPTWGEVFSDTVNAGVYVVEEKVLAAAPAGEAFDFSGDLFPRLLAQGAPLYGFIAPGYWRDIGDPDSYLAAHRDFFAGTLGLHPPGELRTVAGKPAWVDGQVQLDAGVELRGTVVIGPRCRIGDGVRLEDVVLGAGTIVAAGSELRRTVTWEGVQIGAGARIEGAVLGDRVNAGDGCVVEAGAIVADDTSLGREVRVKEGVRIWAAKVVEDFAVVHANLVHADRWRTSAFEEGAVTGLTNLELTPEVAARLGAAYGSLLAPRSTILTVRDAHPASRMLRRAFVGGVGSTGVHVVDLGLLPVPVMRHKLEGFGEAGGVSFQQVQLVRGMTAIRFFDDNGLDISTSFAKSVERVFTREEFRRVQHQEIGVIFEHPRVLDFYSEAYLKALAVDAVRAKGFRLVVDYEHSAAVVVLPRLLAELGCDVVTLNAHTEGGHEALLAGEIEHAQRRLSTIVTSLEADLGVWLYPGAERLAIADRRGRVFAQGELVAVMVAALVAAKLPPGDVVLTAYAPSQLHEALSEAGHRVRETLSAPRALTEASRQRGVLLASSGEGDFIFPALHHAPDALFAVGTLLELLARADRSLEEVADLAPPIALARAALPCPPERTGEVMRRFAERAEEGKVSYLEGVKIFLDAGWVLLRPDRVAPRLHLHAEGRTREEAEGLLSAYRTSVEQMIRSQEPVGGMERAARSGLAQEGDADGK